MFYDDFRIKDYIQIEEFKGIINYITFRNVEIKTEEGDIRYILNSIILLDKPVKNYSKTNIKIINYEFELGIYLFIEVEKLENYLIKNLSLEFDEVIDKNLFYFIISKVTKEFAIIIFEIPVSKYNFKIEEKIQKFTSIKEMEFIGLNSNLKSVNNINNKK